jgi:hypothetical protein
MSLKPRHFVLIAVIIALFGYNIYKHRQGANPSEGPGRVVTTTHPAPVQTPTWTAFDQAAAKRNAPNDPFDPLMQAFQKQLDATHDTTTGDLSGCLTWLQFYRQGVNHPSRDTTWKDRSTRHLDGCSKYHLDTTN